MQHLTVVRAMVEPRAARGHRQALSLCCQEIVDESPWLERVTCQLCKVWFDWVLWEAAQPEQKWPRGGS